MALAAVNVVPVVEAGNDERHFYFFLVLERPSRLGPLTSAGLRSNGMYWIAGLARRCSEVEELGKFERLESCCRRENVMVVTLGVGTGVVDPWVLVPVPPGAAGHPDDWWVSDRWRNRLMHHYNVDGSGSLQYESPGGKCGTAGETYSSFICLLFLFLNLKLTGVNYARGNFQAVTRELAKW